MAEPILPDMTPDYYVKMPRAVVEGVDKLVDMSRTSGGYVQTEADWQTVEAIYKLWAFYYPEDFKLAIEHQKRVRAGAYNEHGTTQEGDGRVLGTFPEKFDQMLGAVFFNQRQDRKFVRKLVKRLPLFQMPEKV